MSEDEETRKRVERLQELSRREWRTPQTIVLDGPGPFELPLTHKPSALGRGSDPQFVLMLESAKGDQTVRIPLLSSDLPDLKVMIDHLYRQFVASVGEAN